VTILAFRFSILSDLAIDWDQQAGFRRAIPLEVFNIPDLLEYSILLAKVLGSDILIILVVSANMVGYRIISFVLKTAHK